MGRRYMSLDGTGTNGTGIVMAPNKPRSLLDSSGSWFARSKPQYDTLVPASWIIVTDGGFVKNDGTGDQTDAINKVLRSAGGKPVFFPAGVYACGGTIEVPEGSVIVGEIWSQIMAVGKYFEDDKNPKVLVR